MPRSSKTDTDETRSRNQKNNENLSDKINNSPTLKKEIARMQKQEVIRYAIYLEEGDLYLLLTN